MGDREQEMKETGAVITPKFAFGINTEIQHNLAYSDDHKIIFPVGRHISCYDFQSKEMTFLLNHEKVRECGLIRVSQDQSHLAVVERLEDAELEQISIFKLDTDKRMKTITLDTNVVLAKQILNLDFNADGKLLMVQCGEPDYTLLIYRWFAGKVPRAATDSHVPTFCQILLQLIAHTRADFPVMAASVCPEAEPLQVVVHGDLRARLMTYDIGSDQFRPQNLQGGLQKADIASEMRYVGHAWLAGGLLAMASNDGTIYLAEGAEVVVKIKTEGDRLLDIYRFGLGFVGLTDAHKVLLYESPDGLSATTQAASSKTAKIAKKGTGEKDPINKIFTLRCRFTTGVSSRLQCASVSPTQDSMVLSTGEAEVLHLTFDDLSFWGDEVDSTVFHKMWQGFHQGSIVGVDLCSQLPLAATAGSDKTIKIWNYESWNCLVHKQMMDQIWSVSLHPSGTSMVLGMSDKLRVFMILKDDLYEVLTIGIRKCDVLCYSHGGKYFAAVNPRTNNIQIFDSYSYAQVAMLDGHMSAVTSMSWSPDDTILMSVGAGGAIYRWDAVKFERMRDSDHVDKAHMFTSVQADQKGIMSIARTEKGRMVTITKDGALAFETQTLPGENPLLMTANDRVILAPTKRGSIITYSCPKTYPAPKKFDATQFSTEYKVHKGSITCAKLSLDGQKLLTCSDDGVMFVSSVRCVVDGSPLEPPPPPVAPFPKICMVLEENQDELLLQLADMQQQLKRSKEDAEYQVVMQTQKLKEELAAMTAEKEELEQNIEEFRNEMHQKQSQAAQDAESRMHDLEKSHMSAAEALENMYERRLLVEVDRFNRLEADKEDGQYAMEERLHTLDQAHKKVMNELTMDYESRIKAQSERITELEDLNQELQGFYDEYIKQQEHDYEEVHDKQQTAFDSERQQLTQDKLKMKTEALMMRTQVDKIKKTMEKEEERQAKLAVEKDSLAKQLGEQRELCGMMEQEVKERNDVIQQNYITIQDLRHKVRDLEMYKFVLGHKADELGEQMEPTKRELKRLQDEMGMQDGELEARAIANQKLKHTINERDANITSLKNELFQARTNLLSTERQMDTFIVELDRAMNMKSMPDKPGRLSDRDKALQKLFRGYVLKTQAIETQEETTAELQRQNMTVEKKSAMLEHRVATIEAARKRKEKKRLEENSSLLKENTELSRANKALEIEAKELKAVIDDYRVKVGSTTRTSSPDRMSSAPTTPSRHPSSPGVFTPPPHLAGPAGLGMRRVGTASAAAGHGRLAGMPGGQPLRMPTMNKGAASKFNLVAGGPKHAARSLRTAGAALPLGAVARGSPARMLHEMVGVEREQVSDLIQQLDTSNAMVDQQRRELQELRSAVLYQQPMDGGDMQQHGFARIPSDAGSMRPQTVGVLSGRPAGPTMDGRPGTTAGPRSGEPVGIEEDAFPPAPPPRSSGRSRLNSLEGGSSSYASSVAGEPQPQEPQP